MSDDRCVDCGCSLKPPRPLYCVGGELHRDASGASYENPADRLAADFAQALYDVVVLFSHGDEAGLWFRLMGINARERMRFFSGLPPADAKHDALLRAIKR